MGIFGKGITEYAAEAAEQVIKVIDVREPNEYAKGHIPGAINVPVETIGEEYPPELPDCDQLILVYCRSGNRSKEAAQKLVDIGYKNVYEFGGIIDWKGEIER